MEDVKLSAEASVRAPFHDPRNYPPSEAVARTILATTATVWPAINLLGRPMHSSEILTLKTIHAEFLSQYFDVSSVDPDEKWTRKALRQLAASPRRVFALIGMDFQTDRAYRANIAAGKDPLVNVPCSKLAHLLRRIIGFGPDDYLLYLGCVNEVAQRAGYVDLTQVLCLDKGWKGRKTCHVLMANAAIGMPVCTASVPADLDKDQDMPPAECATDVRDSNSSKGTATVQAESPTAVQTAVPAEDMKKTKLLDTTDKPFQAKSETSPQSFQIESKNVLLDLDANGELNATAVIASPSQPQHAMPPMPNASAPAQSQHGMTPQPPAGAPSLPRRDMPPMTNAGAPAQSQHGMTPQPPAGAPSLPRRDMPPMINAGAPAQSQHGMTPQPHAGTPSMSQHDTPPMTNAGVATQSPSRDQTFNDQPYSFTFTDELLNELFLTPLKGRRA